jgi:Fe-S-cluster containining protein
MTYTEISLHNLKAKAVANQKETKKLVQNLKRIRPQAVDRFFHASHQREFSKINCLECANCCKSISPAIYDSDVRRMAKTLKMKVPDFIDAYLHPDEEEEYIFKSTPCPFLGEDNYCSIYESRPKACREYPHTNRKRIYQILQLTARNTKVCPVVFNIIESLKNMN